MNDTPDNALLPAGMQDGLPPEAAMEADAVASLMTTFSSWGYQRVKPPLMEFETSLLGGIGKALSSEAFRLQDPVSRRMMALRPDQTPQVARIAGSRMSHSPRPLRLAYSGEIVRVQGSQIRSERQFGQVGAELIGSGTWQADVEVVLMALDALKATGINDITVDLGLPSLVPAIIKDINLDEKTTSALRTALNRKDASEITALEKNITKDAAKALTDILGAVGPAATAIKKLKSIKLDGDAKELVESLSRVVDGISSARPDASITIDPVENRGFEYHSGVAFAFFSIHSRGELGRGGRYQTNFGKTVEQATGLTLFMDTILKTLPARPAKDAILMPSETSDSDAKKLRDEGWVAIKQLDDKASPEAEAKRLGCSHVLKNGKVSKI
ncbi:MAG: ATP phosphoribosyltransferase regulatory subunit [Rhodospirillaceae bacterium]|nr:ATP phosphoribosyltransferase regulatory subunit [Rhodospirillaceae bacterium]MCK5546121.1 ATP phosphoribosyltransferase regulatory subunit [Rhodospirillaceae bacterium]